MTYANEDLHASVTWTGILNLSSISCSSKVSPVEAGGGGGGGAIAPGRRDKGGAC